jgi:hypothetical protein
MVEIGIGKNSFVPRNNTQIEIKEKNFLCNRKHVQLAVA